jgi:TctA family transporter
MVGAFGVIGYLFIKLSVEPAPLLLGLSMRRSAPTFLLLR